MMKLNEQDMSILTDQNSHSEKPGQPILFQDGSRLLSLPPEIRKLILKYLVTSKEVIPVAHESGNGLRKVHLAILRTCRQLHNEGLDLFIKHNVPCISITTYEAEVWVENWRISTRKSRESGDIVCNEFWADSVFKLSRLRSEFSQSPKIVVEGRRKAQYWSICSAIDTISRWLEGCDFHDKEVILAFVPELKNMLEGQVAIRRFRRRLVLIFDGMRCRKFHVLGLDGISTHVANLTQVVEGRLSIPDLKIAGEEMIQHFKRCRSVTVRPAYSTDIDDDDDDGRDWDLEQSIGEAPRRCDASGFEAARATIMSRCKSLYEEFEKRHKEVRAEAARSVFLELAEREEVHTMSSR